MLVKVWRFEMTSKVLDTLFVALKCAECELELVHGYDERSLL